MQYFYSIRFSNTQFVTTDKPQSDSQTSVSNTEGHSSLDKTSTSNTDLILAEIAKLKPFIQAELKKIYGNCDDLVIKEYQVMKELEEFATNWVKTGCSTASNNTLTNALYQEADRIIQRLVAEHDQANQNSTLQSNEVNTAANDNETKMVGQINIIPEDIDYSAINGYYGNGKDNVNDNVKGKEEVVKFIETSLKEQLAEQVTKQLKAQGLEFSDIENLFNNVFTKTSWNTIESFDRGARIKYNVAELINKFVADFNINLNKAINKLNASNTDLDLEDLNLQDIVNNYDVESGEKVNTKSRNGAVEQINAIVSQLTEQLEAKAKAMCEANGIAFDSAIFLQILNNSKAHATENCNMNFNDKKYNGKMFLETFLNNFKASYTTWVQNAIELTNEEKKNSINEVTQDDVKIDKTLIDYSVIEGYYSNETRFSLDTEKAREKIQTLLDSKLKSQLKAQITTQLKAMGLEFADIENLFNNVYTQTALRAIDSCDKGMCLRYNIADLIDNFIVTFNQLMQKAITDVNSSDKDLDLEDIDYTEILEKYDVENNDVINAGKKDAAKKQALEMANILKEQLEAKAKEMCTANGITYSDNGFNTQFNNAVAYAMVNCSMNNRAKRYNPQEFLVTFLKKFEENYTAWIERQ